MDTNKIYCGDSLEVLKTLPSESIDCCITSPPYWGLRDYGVTGQIGLEKTPEKYVAKMVDIFSEVKQVLKKEGTLWLNLGDSYQSHPGDYTKCGGFQGIEARKDDIHLQKYHPLQKGIVSKGCRDIGLKPKNLVGVPWRVAFALQKDGWYLRQDIIWHKPNPMPESITDRCTKAHEYIFLLTKNQKYYFDNEAIKEPAVSNENRPDGIVRNRKYGYNSKLNKLRGGHIAKDGQKMNAMSGIIPQHTILPSGFRNKRSVWTVPTKPFKSAHFATFPEDLIRPCILAGCPIGGIVLDPFLGAGTTGLVAKKLNRNYIGIELNPEYVEMAEERIRSVLL